MIPSFHAHVYYDPETRGKAGEIRKQLDATFPVDLGRWRDEPVGPHPRSMYQVAFAGEHFAEITQWLMLNRQGLTILVHPNTGDDVADHRDYPLWLGEVLPLDIEFLRNLEK